MTDASAIQVLVEILEKEELPTGPATSCSIAAQIQYCTPPGKNVLVVLCSANVVMKVRYGLRAFITMDDDFDYSDSITDIFCIDAHKDACRFLPTKSPFGCASPCI